ncbi:hypothetical protein SDC9_190030 [bioreactor metagenome]|uniref:Uncharacterized protein n=1 Tax=bioreactor metagenome TaxID=1076179 RepID=A0A645I4R5_9ZZZZ
MLSHISQSSAIVIPVSAEGAMYPVCVVWLVRCRPQPHVIIQLFGDGLWFQVSLTHPEEFPVEPGVLADGHLQWPAQHAAVDQFF